MNSPNETSNINTIALPERGYARMSACRLICLPITWPASWADSPPQSIPRWNKPAVLLFIHEHRAHRRADGDGLPSRLQLAGVRIQREHDDGIGRLIFREQPAAGRINRKVTRRAAQCGLMLDEG